VTVYERNALGGKARSIPVPGTAAGGRRALPGEHGFRFFPGFYHHVPDTMRRIPFPGNPNGVHDNLVTADGGKWLRSGDRPDGGPADGGTGAPASSRSNSTSPGVPAAIGRSWQRRPPRTTGDEGLPSAGRHTASP
jgi:hypothetical protein